MKILLIVAAMAFGLAATEPASAGAAAPNAAGLADRSAVIPAIAGGPMLGQAPSANLMLVQRRERARRRAYRRGFRRGRRAERRNWRRGRYYGRRYDRDDWDGPGLGAALTLGLVGALVASGIDRAAAEDRIARCESQFRSFDRSSGTYTTYGGETRVCPYLR